MKGNNLYMLLVCGSKLPLPTWTGKNRRFQFGYTYSEGKRRCERIGVLALGYEWGRIRPRGCNVGAFKSSPTEKAL